MRITTLMDHDVTTGLLWDFVRDWFRYNVWGRRPWRPGRKGMRFPNGIPRADISKPIVRLWDREWNYIGKLDDIPDSVTIDYDNGLRWSGRIELIQHVEYLEQITAWNNPYIPEDTKPFSPVMDLELTEDEAKSFYGDQLWQLPDDPFDPAGWDLENMVKEWERTQGCDGCKGDCCGD